jgi:cbb3-type cytochrome oxidase subunit 1
MTPMPLAEFWMAMESWPVSMRIGESAWFPLLESLHVVGATFVVGSILMVDLRLLRLAGREHALSRLMRDVVPWTWGAFVVAAVTGLGLFITRASAYVENRAFQIKVLLLLLAGINMLLLHRVTLRERERLDSGESRSTAAQMAGACSLVVWIGVIVAGRWVGHLS